MENVQWWGYRHSNGSIILKRWFGDHEDYTGDCIGNSFVEQVVTPFNAETQEIAKEILTQRLQ